MKDNKQSWRERFEEAFWDGVKYGSYSGHTYERFQEHLEQELTTQREELVEGLEKMSFTEPDDPTCSTPIILLQDAIDYIKTFNP